MIVNTIYDFGDIVFLKTDPEQLERIVYKFIVTKGDVVYGLAMGATFSEHFEYEITAEKGLLKELNISEANKA